MSIIDHHQPPNDCPYCGKMNDMAAPVGKDTHPPRAGDVSICIGCGNFSIFDGDGLTHRPTDEELAVLKADDAGWALLQAACAAVRAAKETQ